MDEGQLQEIDKMRGKKSRSQFVRERMSQPQNQPADDKREIEAEQREERRRERDREREESNREEERKLEREAEQRGEFGASPSSIGDKVDFAERADSFASAYSKSQLGRMVAKGRDDLKELKGKHWKLCNVVSILKTRFPDVDMDAVMRAVALSPPPQYQQPIQLIQEEKESESSGWMKELMPIFAMKAIFGENQKPQQPLITPEVLAMLKPRERIVKVTDKNGNITEMSIELYMQSQQRPAPTIEDVVQVMEKYKQKENDAATLIEQMKSLKDLNSILQGETPEVAKVKEEETTKRQRISTDKEIELAKLNAKERQAKVTEKLINMAMGISPDTPEQQQQQCGPQQSMEDRISEEFMRNALGGPITK